MPISDTVRAGSRRLRSSAQGDRGAVLVIVAISLVVLLGMTALAIDLSSFYKAQRQAQTAADAGALAGAQDLVRSATSASGDATTLARQNYPGATVTADATSTVNQITVSVKGTTPTFFGKILGLGNETVGARAVAGPTTGKSCSNPAAGSANCDAIFARDTSCSPSPISLSGGGLNIQGGIWSDGSVSQTGGNSTLSGPLTFGTGSGCGWTGSTGGSQPVSAVPTTWPIDYGLDFPACTGAACTGPIPTGGTSHTPSFCTLASTALTWSPTTVTSGNIYCAVGSGTPGDPSTWNGGLTITLVGGTTEASYLGGSVTVHFSSSATMEPCGYGSAGYTSSGCNAAVPGPSVTTNYPLVYALGTGSAATLSGGAGSGTVIGDVFAPNGLLSFGGGGAASIGFLEGLDVSVSGGGLSGDGPSTTSSTTTQSSVALLQ
jgi:Putative Flp pilus-assembly TadE/G-like